MTPDRRRDLRRNCVLDATIRGRRGVTTATTLDVSRHGVFLGDEMELAEREVFKLQLSLPDAEPVEMMAQVSRRVTPAEAELRSIPSGVGVDFVALSRRAKARWEAFVAQVPEPTANGDQPASDSADSRRRHERHETCFLVRLGAESSMGDYYSRNISGGGALLLVQPLPRELERPDVDLILVHPETDEEFELSARVLRIVAAPALSDSGLAIEFNKLSPEREAALLSFIVTGANFLGRPERQVEQLARLREAADAEGASSLPLVALAQTLHELKGPQTALSSYQSALARDADCTPALRGLARAYRQLGLEELAEKHDEEVRLIEAREREY